MKFKKKEAHKKTFQKRKLSYSLPPEMYFKMFVDWSREKGLKSPVLPEKFVEGADIADLCLRHNVKSFRHKAGCYFLEL